MKVKLLSIALFLFCLAPAFGQEQAKEALSAARSGYRDYLQKIPHGQEKDFGFKSRAEFAKASVGKAYRVITLKRDFYSGSFSPEKDYLVTTGEFRFVIQVKGNYRVLVTVTQFQGRWQVVNIGSAAMATELQQLEKKFGSQSGEGQMLVVHGINGDFFLHGNTPSAGRLASPLASARLALNWGAEEGPKSLNELLPLLKRASDNNKQNNRQP
jgi:hypothetical protein